MYSLHIIPPAQKDLDGLDKRFFGQVKKKILSLAVEPRPAGCLKLTNEEGYRIRSGDYRILYRIDDKEKRVCIYRVKHRKESYRF